MKPDFSGLMEKKKPAPQKSKDRLLEIDLDKIDRDPKNVRKTFPKEELEGLAASIKERGLLQPALVRPNGEGRFKLVAGERRWRASKMAGKKTLLAVEDERKVDNQIALDQLIENMQRENLKPSEIISGMLEAKNGGLKAVEISRMSGISKAMVSKYLKLAQKQEYIDLADEIGVKAAYERVLEDTGSKRAGEGVSDSSTPEKNDEAEEVAASKDRKTKAKVEPLACQTTTLDIDGKTYQLSRAWVIDDTGEERPVVFG